MQRIPSSASFYLNAFGTQCDTLQIRENIMHAYYEIETEIPNNHQLNLSLPNDIPAGKAKIAIIYELPIKPENKIAKPQNSFFEIYINNPIKLSQFTPLNRDDIYER
jgi:hypothetical protein